MADGSRSTEILSVRVALIDAWTKNPRKAPFDVSDIVATLIADGQRIPGRAITEALKLRREPSGRFTALKGSRRLMAAAIAGIDELPGELVDWDDDRALDEALVDEARRALTPLEEAHAIAALRARGLDDVAIARRAGRGIEHVRRRLALLDTLLPAGQEALAQKKISEGLANKLARLSSAVPKGAKGSPQEQAIADVVRGWQPGVEPATTKDAYHLLRRASLTLAAGGFRIEDATLPGGSCLACPKRSGAQATFFAELVDAADTCTDAACFGAKREAHAARAKQAAKARGIPVVEAKDELKKLYPYGGDRLAHDAPVVDLDEDCDLIEPPTVPTPKNEGRHGGPETCSVEGSDGKHAFQNCIREDDDGGGEDDRAAAVAGCEAWEECDCGAWRERDAPPWHKAIQRGWKQPKWRDVLGDALKQTGAAAEPAPAMVAVTEDGAHELFNRKVAVEALQRAGVIDAQTAKNEIREASPTPEKKPGTLEKWQVDQKAAEIATAEARALISLRAEKKKPDDVKIWRLLAGLVLSRHQPLDLLDPAAARRRESTAKKGAKSIDELRAWVGAQKEHGPVRGLVVELLTGDTYGDDSQLAIACRALDVDLAALTKAAAAKVRADAKAKAKKAADKAKASPKAAKKTPAKASADDDDEEEDDSDAKPVKMSQTEHDEIVEQITSYLDEDSATEAKIIKDCAEPSEPDDPAKIRIVLADLVRTGGLRLEEDLYSVAPEASEQAPKEEPKALTEEHRLALDTLVELGQCTARDVSNSFRSMTPERAEAVLKYLAALDLCVFEAPHWKATAAGRAAAPCPLSWAYVVTLGKRIGIVPHSGAQSRANVWGCVTRIRARSEEEITRDALHKAYAASGTDTVDLAILCLMDLDGFTLRPGRAKHNDVLCRPGTEPTPADTVQLEGDGKKAVQARACPKCGVKAGATYCLSAKGKLGGGWFHRERAVEPAAAKVDQRSSKTSTRGMLARGPAVGGTPAPDLVEAVRKAADLHKAAIREFVIAHFAKTAAVEPAKLHDLIRARFGDEAWFGSTVAATLVTEALNELEDRGAIHLRGGAFHRLDPSSVPCNSKGCGVAAGVPCKGLDEGGYHPARVRTARAQPTLPGLTGQRPADETPADKLVRLAVEAAGPKGRKLPALRLALKSAAPDATPTEREEAIGNAIRAGRLVDDGDKITAKK